MCEVGKLFWMTPIPNPTKCSGHFEHFGCEQDVHILLSKNHCLERGDVSTHSVQKLILNRISPYKLDPENLSKLTICTFHKVINCYNILFFSIFLDFSGMAYRSSPLSEAEQLLH